MSALFHVQVFLGVFCTSFVEKINISLTILVVFDLFIKILNFTNSLEIMMTSSKESRDPDYYFGTFCKILCSATFMQGFKARA